MGRKIKAIPKNVNYSYLLEMDKDTYEKLQNLIAELIVDKVQELSSNN